MGVLNESQLGLSSVRLPDPRSTCSAQVPRGRRAGKAHITAVITVRPKLSGTDGKGGPGLRS